MTAWFVSYREKASGRDRLVGPFDRAEHAEAFMMGLVYQGQRYENCYVLIAEKP